MKRFSFILWFLILVPTAWSASEPKYVFSQHLKEAQTSLKYHDTREVIQAEWINDRFEFPSLPEDQQIYLKNTTFNAEPQSGIYVHAKAEAMKRLHFQKVPPGSKLVIHYGIEDAEFSAVLKANVYLKVWMGNHMLKRILIPNQKGWHQETLDLGVASFFNRPVTITFDINTDLGEKRHLVFDAFLY